jgi:ribokinase
MITVVGSVNVDLISYAKNIPVLGETVIGNKFIVTPGGKGANQASAAARLGAKTVFLGKVGGNDKHVDIIWDGFKWAGVDVSKVEIESDIHCGVALIMVGENSQNIITIVSGANGRMRPEDIDRNYEQLAASKIVVTEFGIPIETAEYTTRVAKKLGVTTLVNPAPAVPISEEFYNAIDFIIPNESEATILSGVTVIDRESAERAAEFFHRKNVQNVVITLGNKGVFVSTFKHSEFLDIIPVKAIDTAGSGDAFIGGLAYALWKGENLFSAARFANAVAARSVMKAGTLISMPERSEVESLLKQYNFDL